MKINCYNHGVVDNLIPDIPGYFHVKGIISPLGISGMSEVSRGFFIYYAMQLNKYIASQPFLAAGYFLKRAVAFIKSGQCLRLTTRDLDTSNRQIINPILSIDFINARYCLVNNILSFNGYQYKGYPGNKGVV